MNKQIEPVNKSGGSCKFRIHGYTANMIAEILGFEANADDDPSKVKYSWGFKINGKHYGIWDYKGSHEDRIFSADGDFETLADLFGAAAVRE